MIVRDEAAVIERCLRSCLPHIDYWVICDTGSSDATPEIIQRVLNGIPGELHHHEWRDFGHNRTQMIELARNRADYLLVMDADWRLEAAPGAFTDLSADAYMVRHAGATELFNKELVSGHIPWRYEGAVHEYITSPLERTCERLENVLIHVESVGGSRYGRWARDRELLQAAVLRDPADTRSAFYLAQTLRDLGHERGDPELLAEAQRAYEHRAGMAGWAEESYVARHQAGLLAWELDDWPVAADHFASAWELRPVRLEAVRDLAQGLRERGQYRVAHRFSSLAAGLAPLPVPDDNLFVAPWVYRWGLLFEYSITAYWVGDPRACVRACDVLLGMPELPEGHHAQTRANRSFGIRAQAAQAGAAAISSTLTSRRSG